MIGRHVIVGCAIGLAVAPLVASAGAQRTFVASTGDDTNTCTLPLPCRSFAAAIMQTNPGGEVVVLDSGGYGPVTITQGVSIIAPPGVYAGISVFGVGGIGVNAGPTDKVVLRGLSISGQGGLYGIGVAAAGELHIEKCVVSNMMDSGIFVAADTRMEIRDTSVHGNGGAGLWISAGAPVVDIIDSQFMRNGALGLSGPLPGIVINSGTLNAQRIVANSNAQFGIVAAADIGSTVVATISDSTLSGNTNGGALAASSPMGGGTSTLTVIRSTIAKNGGVGVLADATQPGMQVSVQVSDSAVTENGGPGVETIGATTTARVTRSTIAGNVGPDFSNTAGAFLSAGNNTLTGRGAGDIQGTITANPPQ